MSDAKFFQRGKVQEFREELIDEKKDPKFTKKRNALKKIVANMTMGNDMSALFPDVISCIQIPDIEIKKMVYLFVVNYAKVKSELVLLTVNSFLKDASDTNPLIRALAIRTMAYIHVDKVIDCLCEPLRNCCVDKDPYVRKTAAICVSKVYFYSKELAETEGLIECLKKLLYDSNPTVVANALAALVEINDKSEGFDLDIDMTTASTLVTALNDCSEWGQTYILEALMFVVPTSAIDAESLIERLFHRLQHANSGVVLATVKVIINLLNYVKNEEFITTSYRKLGPPLVTLTSGQAETQYVVLKNIILIIQKRPDFLQGEMKVFFCKYNDPIYVKLSKLEVMFRLANETTVDILLAELKEYATEVDVEFVRKAVRSIGKCAIKVESSADKCVQALVELIQTKVNYVVQEGIVVIRDIFRKYPNRYESVIGVLCENLDSLDEPEAKSSMIWIIGHYADRIENSAELLESFIETFLEEPAEIQLALLTATMKLFIKRPNQAKTLVPKILKWATEEMDNPDVRDRGYFYWRLLSSDPVSAKKIVFCEQFTIYTETDNMDPLILDDLLNYIDTLSSVYHKPPKSMFPHLKPRGFDDGQLPGSAQAYSQNKMYPAVVNPYSNDPQSVPRQQQMNNNLLDLDLDFDSSASAPSTVQNTSYIPASSSQQASSFGMSGLDQLTTQNFGGSANDILNLAHVQYGYVAPKNQFLSASAGKGLEITGTFSRRNGTVNMDLTVSNKSLQPLNDFMMQFNKNSFGFVAGKFEVFSPLMPNQTCETNISLTINPAQIQLTTPLNSLHVAVKDNIGVFFFQCSLPFHVLFIEDGKLLQQEFLQTWNDLASQQCSANLDSFKFSSIDGFCQKLALNNVFTIAQRPNEDKFFVFASCILEGNVKVLAEFQIFSQLSSGLVNIRSSNAEISKLFIEALQNILKN